MTCRAWLIWKGLEAIGSTDREGFIPIREELKEGPNVVGRRTFGITDAKVSRKQVTVTFDSKSGKVSVAMLNGLNPSFVRSGGTGEETEVLKGQEYQLANKDTILLIRDRFPIEVEIDGGCPTPVAAIHRDGSGFCLDTPALESRVAGAPDDRPLCRYGKECYRKNPEHFLQFAHPHMDVPRKRARVAADAPDADNPKGRHRTPGKTGSSPDGAGGSFSGHLAVAPAHDSRHGSDYGSGSRGHEGDHIHPDTGADGGDGGGDGDGDGDHDGDGDGDHDGESDAPVASLSGKGLSFAMDDPPRPPYRPPVRKIDKKGPTSTSPLPSSAGPGTPKEQMGRNASVGSVASSVGALRPLGHILVTPVLSAGRAYDVPLSAAAETAITSLLECCEKHPAAVFQIVILVTDKETELKNMLDALVATAQEKGRWDDRVRVCVGDITRPREACGVVDPRQHITVVNRCNYRLLARGPDPLNRAIHMAAGGCLEELSKEASQVISVGHTRTVKLPKTSPFRADRGVRWVMNALGPSMARGRADSLTDLEECKKVLADTYRAVMHAFENLSKKFSTVSPSELVMPSASTGVVPARLPLAGARGPTASAEIAPTGDPSPSGAKEPYGEDGEYLGGGVEESKSMPCTTSATVSSRAPASGPSWAVALEDYISGRCKTGVVESNDLYVIIKDKFPKAKHHYLLIAKGERFRRATPSDLTNADLSSLQTLHAAAQSFADGLAAKEPRPALGPPLKFLCGYHAIPSMKPLHIHIISQDFVSPSLKTKKHFLSFTTRFFVTCKELEGQLRYSDKLSFNKAIHEAMLKGSLDCHRCFVTFGNMPSLKTHLAKCTIPFQ